MTPSDWFHTGLLIVGIILVVATVWSWPEDRG